MAQAETAATEEREVAILGGSRKAAAAVQEVMAAQAAMAA